MATKGHLLYYPEGKHDILLGKELNDVLKSKVNSVTKITYKDLKDLRDNSKLIPGSLYRITDYNCTTTQENTRSAGHQFDIVLLALSENKLAEEGWAMEHPTDVYDVTINDDTPRKCYLYPLEGGNYNVVDINTKLGFEANSGDIGVDEVTKTAIFNDGSGETADECLINENLTYNYFQNSKLNAWKVWYCLDNDKSRFAWADDSVDEELGTITCSGTFSAMYSSNIICTRRSNSDFEQDGIHYYCYFGVRPGPQVLIYTTTENITYNTIIYEASHDGQGGGYTIKTIEDAVINSFTPTIITISGTGVIYRLIDEWNNDVGYDFKNIQFDLGKSWYAPFCDGEKHTRDASLDGTFVNNKVIPNGEGLLGIISNNTYDVKGCIFVHTDQNHSFQPADNAYNVIIKDGNDLRLW